MIFFNLKEQKGFTLIEVIVSLSVFTVVLFIATTSLLSIVDADRRARSTRILIDNLNLTFDDMTRNIKTGSRYYCGSPDTGGTGDCVSGGNSLFFTSQDGTRMSYTFDNEDHSVFRTTGAVTDQITSSEFEVDNLKFFVSGSDSYFSGDRKQPKVTLVIEGSLGTDASVKIQSAITQRAYDN